MNDRDDPPYIVNLLNPETDHNCYFIVGDPKQGPVERIGVVAAMLMAHSMLLRKALSIVDTEHNERWDNTITDIQPNVFKNLLKFIYAYNNIKSYSILEALEMLKVAERLVMEPLQIETTQHIISLLSPATVCIALSYPVVLQFSNLENRIAKIVRDNTKAVLDSETLHYLSPMGMKYIVQMDSATMQVSWAEVWRGVIKWARTKVLKLQSPSDPSVLEKFTQSRLIVPSKEHSEKCCLTVIQLVEEAIEGGSSSSAALLLNYHLVPTNHPERLFICTRCSDNNTLIHEEMDVKTILDCSFWAKPIHRISSDLYIDTGNAIVELHSIICSGKRKCEVKESIHRLTKDDKLVWYQCIGSVTVSLVSCEDETSVANIKVKEEVTFDEEFEIVLLRNSNKLKLLPHSKYRIQTNFVNPHPLWYANDHDYLVPKSCNDFDMCCGIVNRAKLWKGSHVKYIIYRTIIE